MNHSFLFLIGVASVGCAAQQADDQGNDQLGIARFVVEESQDRSVVIGLDADEAEVGRLELVHGRFALSPAFAEDYETAEVVGRKLDVDVLDQQLIWETAGYEPVLEMPAHPASQWALATFLADPQVKAVLDRWQIGFLPFEGSLEPGETAYAGASYPGHSASYCNSNTCGTAYYGTINTCGGGAAAIEASRVTRKLGTNCGLYTSSYDEIVILQCCPSGSGGQSTRWFATKACPNTADHATSCGTHTAGACKGCPGYPAAAAGSCDIYITPPMGACSGNVYGNAGNYN